MTDTVKNEISINNSDDDLSLSNMTDTVKNEISINNSDIDDTVKDKIVINHNEMPHSDIDDTVENKIVINQMPHSDIDDTVENKIVTSTNESSKEVETENFESELDELIQYDQLIANNLGNSGINHNYFLDSLLGKTKDDNSFELSEEDMEALSQNVIDIEEQRQQSIQELAHNSLVMSGLNSQNLNFNSFMMSGLNSKNLNLSKISATNSSPDNGFTVNWQQFEEAQLIHNTPTEELQRPKIKSSDVLKTYVTPKSPQDKTEVLVKPKKKQEKKQHKTRRRVKTPVLLQLEATECGAASLGIILQHYGCYISLSELRVACGVSRDGSKASNILKAARQYGLSCKGYKKNLDDVMDLPCPFIIFWNFNHFLVVEGFNTKKKIVYLNDPAHGYRKVSLNEFDESFTGVVLTLEPNESFKKIGKKGNVWNALSKRLLPTKSVLFYLLIVAFILTIPGLLIPTYTRIFLDEILGESRNDWLKPLIWALGVTAFFQLCLEIIKYIALRRLEIVLSANMSKQFFEHLLKLPLQFYSQRYDGEISSRQKLNDNMAEILSGKLADTCIKILMMIFYATLMFYYNVKLTIIGIFFAVLMFYILKLCGKKRSDDNSRMRQDFGKVVGDSIAALQAMETIKVSGQESVFFSKWSGRYAKAINSLQSLQITTQSITVLPVFFNSINTMLIYLVGAYCVIEGEMSTGTLIAFTALMTNFQTPIKDLVDLGGDIQNLDGDLKRLDDVLSAKPDLNAWSGKEEDISQWPLQLQGHVSIQDVTFGYSPIEKPLFENINIDIAPGKWVALVGSSGSGKTTLGNMICGLYQPWSGAVLFDGHKREEIPHSVMINTFAAVSQDIFLFEGTIRDNLTLWDNTIPNEVLYKACEDAAILDVVQAIPGGLDGHLIEGGANLSGGQRQRLEIARALVMNPSILVLDEATSALDAETEHTIIERLHWRGCTCIMVAHRLSTIRDCDEIIVLEKGKIAERGTHEELWKNQATYANLLRVGEALGEVKQ